MTRKKAKPSSARALFIAGTVKPGLPNTLAPGETGGWIKGSGLPSGVVAVRVLRLA